MGWTDAQGYCIDARGGTVLVSAAAGSGKTTVLVERVAQRVADRETPVDIDRMLIVTFTQAAAAEMKQRLAKRLAKCLQEDPDNARLARQQMLLPSAQISTIHGFCTAFLRENFEAAGISPRFTVAEERVAKMLQAEALEETLEIFYAAAEDGFLRFCKTVNGTAKDDRDVRKKVLEIYDDIQAQAFPLQWLREACSVPSADKPLFETVWGKKLHTHATAMLAFVTERVTQAMAALAENETYAKFYARIAAFPAELHNAACVFADAANGWDACKRAVDGVWPPTLSGKKDVDPLLLEPVEAAWGLVKDVIKELKGFFAQTEAEVRAGLVETAPALLAVYELVETFTKRFAAKKRERGCLDFNDLEHVTLRLLCDEQTGEPTLLARETAEKYTEIYVDEYQDTNEAQDTIFRMLDYGTKKSFFVGDVKQSIYGFRQANPQIFLSKKAKFTPYDGKTFPACISLDKNFRSRHEVTGIVNFVCSQVMTADFCGIDYRGGEELVHGADEADNPSPVEILLAENPFSAAEMNVEQLEARVIAERVADLIQNGRVTEKDKKTDTVFLRPVRYGDICILLRGRGNRPIAYAAALEEKGIPVRKDKTLPLFATEEVGTALSFLRAVDNPLRDVPLMAVMLSPSGGFSADECAQIRICAKEARYTKATSLYAALLIAEKGDVPAALQQKIRSFLALLRHYRRLAATLDAEAFINRLYDDTGMTLLAAAGEDGIQKVANLRALAEIARGYESNSFKGLSAFVRYIDRMESEQADMAAPSPAAGQVDAVSIMTIHGSKGLEFPIVILGNMAKSIREDSDKDPFCMHGTGAGTDTKGAASAALMLYDEDTAETAGTAAVAGIHLAKRYTQYAEEARLLYVALTRAKEKLICVYTDYRLFKHIEALAQFVPREDTFSTAALIELGSVGEWLLAALLRHPEAHLLRHIAGAIDIETIADETPLICRQIVAADYLPQDDAAAEEDPGKEDDGKVPPIEGLYERLSYRYPYALLDTVPVKLAASELAHRDADNAFVATRRPAFLSETGLTPAEKGTALHTFMQFADFTAASVAPEKEADRLYDEGFLTAAQREVLDTARIAAFFAHPLYARMCAADKLWREHAFTVPLSVAALDPALSELAEETLVVQGIADCVFEEDGALVIVDYKTDRVKDTALLRQRYAKQLEIYREALEQTLSKPVKEMLLYGFHLDDTVTI